MSAFQHVAMPSHVLLVAERELPDNAAIGLFWNPDAAECALVFMSETIGTLGFVIPESAGMECFENPIPLLESLAGDAS